MLDIATLLALPAVTVYKSDRRSRVWRVRTPEGQDWVIKQFMHAPLRQRLARLLHLHPAQRELSINQQMRAAGLPIAPIVAHGWHQGRACLATPWLGPSLCRLMQDRTLTPAQRRAMPANLAQLVAQLLHAGWFFRDLKTSNILVDSAGKLWLIDVGSARRDRAARHARRMLANLDQTAVRDGASRAERLRFERGLAEVSSRSR